MTKAVSFVRYAANKKRNDSFSHFEIFAPPIAAFIRNTIDINKKRQNKVSSVPNRYQFSTFAEDKANKEQTNSADNSTKNYVTFNNCTFNGPTGKVLQSLSSSKK